MEKNLSIELSVLDAKILKSVLGGIIYGMHHQAPHTTLSTSTIYNLDFVDKETMNKLYHELDNRLAVENND